MECRQVPGVSRGTAAEAAASSGAIVATYRWYAKKALLGELGGLVARGLLPETDAYARPGFGRDGALHERLLDRCSHEKSR